MNLFQAEATLSFTKVSQYGIRRGIAERIAEQQSGRVNRVAPDCEGTQKVIQGNDGFTIKQRVDDRETAHLGWASRRNGSEQPRRSAR
jgi:hypothetical protein